MIRITIELAEDLAALRRDDSLRERLRRGLERDQKILRRLDDEPPFQIPGVPIRFL